MKINRNLANETELTIGSWAIKPSNPLELPGKSVPRDSTSAKSSQDKQIELRKPIGRWLIEPLSEEIPTTDRTDR